MGHVRIRIDDGTWNHAPKGRRREWTAVIEDLEREELTLPAGSDELIASLTAEGFELTARGEGKELGRAAIPRDKLAPHIQEYVDIVRQMQNVDAGLGSSRLEALDMAKKVAHDDAGRTIERRCRALGVDHPTARRLFTLLFSLRVDTSHLLGVRGHRPVR